MRPWLLIAAILATAAPGDNGAAQEQAKDIFSRYQAPAGSEAEPIGSYSRGCLAGGVALSPTTDRWQAMRPSRNRNWGHPALIAFIERLSGVARQVGWPGLYVGDLSQPRGGPMAGGHRSHQIGLDADVWLRRPERIDLTRAERDTVSSYVVVTADGRSLNNHWTPGHFQLLKAAASDPAVARIFVNPAIKKGLCEGEPATDPAGRAWLSKVRPWKGHNAHFHVRLACPDRSGDCTDQPPPPPGDGCGAELETWLDKVAARSAAATTRALQDPESVFEEEDWYDEDTGQDEFSGTRGLGRKVLTLDQLPEACRALADADPLLATGPGPVQEQEITALYGIAGSRYLWVLPLDRDLANDPGVRFESTDALPPGLSAAPGREGGLVIQGTPEAPGDFRFGIVARDGAGVRARFAVAMAVEPGRTQGGAVVVPRVPSAPAPALASIPSTGAAAALAMPPSAREMEVRAFLRGFQGGDCFYAQPARVADASAEIEAFSDRQAPVYELDTAFVAAMGFEATIGARLVGPGHCAAVAFARLVADSGGPAPKIVIDDVTPGSGGYLSGRVDTPAGMSSVLLVVDPGGAIDVAARGLRGSRQYSYRTRGPAGPHLLLAVASAVGDAADTAAGDGGAVFARLATEARSRAGALTASVRYFTVQ